jgi:hypothetical protein
MADSRERPVVHCLIAWPLGEAGAVRRIQRVPLSTAALAMKAGLYVVGPDPDEWTALMEWEREHAAPFNPPRP